MTSSVVIYEIFGGGGSSAGVPNADYVVLHNTTGSAISLAGMAVQVSNGGAGGGGNNNPFTVVALSGSIGAFGYYLIQLGTASGTGTALPTPDLVSASGSLGANNGRVALTSDTTQISNAAGNSSGGSILDFVGFGTSANSYEGSSPAPAPSNSTAIVRDAAGGWDTDSNSADFAAAAPAPKNSSYGTPTFTSNNTAGVNENTTAVLDINVTDNEGYAENGGGVTYAFVAGGDEALFTLDADIGALAFVAAPDFEAGGDNSYVVTVRATDTAGAQNDQQITITVNNVSPETLTGTAGVNTLVGGSDLDKIFGLGGNDRLYGLEGADTLTGGAGRDFMWGGTGADDFDFNNVVEIGKNATRDVIRDFQHLVDDIDLSTIDANGVAAGNAAFKFLAAKGAAFTGVKGQLHWFQAGGSTYVEGDINGDAKADFQIQITGLVKLTVGDFIL